MIRFKILDNSFVLLPIIRIFAIEKNGINAKNI